MPNVEIDANVGVERSEAAAVNQLGSHGHSDFHGENDLAEWLRVGFIAVVIGLVWWGAVPRFHRVDLLALAGIAIGGLPILQKAIARPTAALQHPCSSLSETR